MVNATIVFMVVKIVANLVEEQYYKFHQVNFEN